MASSRDQSWSLFTEENMKKNKLGKKHRMNCKINGDMIEYDKGGTGWKNTIRLDDLDEVEMNEKYTLDRHKYENIICLKRGKDVKFLKAESRSQMEEWYNQLMTALKRFGWITDTEVECTIDGKKRRATNPEGFKRPNFIRARKPVSAFGGLEGTFKTETAESSTDSSSDESLNSTPTDIKDQPQYEDRFPAPSAYTKAGMAGDDNTYVNMPKSKKPPVPERKESMHTNVPAFTRKTHRIPVESDENVYMGLLPTNETSSPSQAATAGDDYRDIKTSGDFLSKQTMLQNMLISNKGPQPLTPKPGGRYTSHPILNLPRPQSGTDKKPIIQVPTKLHADDTSRSRETSLQRQTQSFRQPPTQPKPTRQLQRKGSVPQLKRVEEGGESCTHAVECQPKLPQRNGQSLVSAVEKFRSEQEEQSIDVVLPKDTVSNGKRLCLVKVKGTPGLWLDHWNLNGCPLEETLHPGDQILSINGIDLEDSEVTFAYDLMAKVKGNEIRMSVRRALHASVLLLRKTMDKRHLGIETDGVVITKVHHGGLFHQATKSKTTSVLRSGDVVEWAITEINMQPVNSKYTTQQVLDLLEKADPDVALVIQPSDLILAMKEALSHCPMCGGAAHTCR